MSHLLRVSSFPRPLVFLSALIVSVSATASDTDCEIQWKKSSAYKSCYDHHIQQAPKGVCTLAVACNEAATKYPGPVMTSTWTLDSVSKLTNDNGRLTGGEVPKAVAPAVAPVSAPATSPKVQVTE